MLYQKTIGIHYLGNKYDIGLRAKDQLEIEQDIRKPPYVNFKNRINYNAVDFKLQRVT